MQQNTKRTRASVLLLIGFALGVALSVGLAIYDDMVHPRFPQRLNATRASIAAIDTAIKTFEIMMKRYPQSAKELTAPIGDKPPLLKAAALIDSWGTPFQITFDGDTYEIRSAGPDRQMGNEDDLTN